VGAFLFGIVGLAAVAGGVEPADQEVSSEIVVTGERVKRSLKDTPSSVVVFTKSDIDAQAADRLDQLLALVPNVQLGNGSEGPAIRGQDTTGVLQALDAFLGGARSRATVEVDGRAIGYQEYICGSAPLWDVSQVEVFRSPLTVTHGRNSIAGGIVITTNDPTYDWEGQLRLVGGNFSTRQGSGVVSGPIVADQLAFRLAGDVRYASTTSTLARLQRGADPNDDDYSVLRLKLLGEPKGLPGLRLLGTFTRTYSQMPQIVTAAPPFRERRDPGSDYGIYGVHVSAATLHATQEFGKGEIEAIVSDGHAHTRRYAPLGLGESKSRFDDLSGELFGNWNLAPSVTLRGGVYRAAFNSRQYIDLTHFIASEGSFRDRQQSFGAFAEADVTVAERLTLTAGARYQQDRQRRVGGLSGLVKQPVDLDADFSAWLPKLSASYALTPSINAGVLLQRAYNPGGATLALDTGETDMFGAEWLWDYEAFLKGRVPNLRISIAANLFYNDIRDAQRGVLVPLTLPGGGHDFFVRYDNVPKASTYGAELQLSWNSTAALTLGGGLGLLWTRILDAGSDAVIGHEFERGPHLTASASANWAPTKRLQLSAQLRYHSGFFSNDFETPDSRVEAAAIVDARAAYEVRGITVFAYAHNAFDSFHIAYRFGPNWASLEDPLVVGLGFEAAF